MVAFPTFDEFREWLYNLPPSHKMMRRHCASCPLAEFLANYWGVKVIWVREDDVSCQKTMRKLPPWAKRFIRRLDAGTPLVATAYDCLTITKCRAEYV